MNIKTQILKAFDSGKTAEAMKKDFAPGSIFKYKRLYCLIQIDRKIRDLIDTEAWEGLNLPELKRVLSEVQKW